MWETLRAIVIGLLAPAGIWLGWLLQRRDKASDRERDKSELLRQKAEEIYDEIEQIRERNIDAVMGAIEYQFKSDAKMPDLIPKLGRLQSLVNMYFPDGAVIIEQFNASIQKPVQDLAGTIATIEATHQQPAKKLEQIKQARTVCVQDVANNVVTMLASLTHFMNSEAKKLI